MILIKKKLNTMQKCIWGMHYILLLLFCKNAYKNQHKLLHHNLLKIKENSPTYTTNFCCFISTPLPFSILLLLLAGNKWVRIHAVGRKTKKKILLPFSYKSSWDWSKYNKQQIGDRESRVLKFTRLSFLISFPLKIEW